MFIIDSLKLLEREETLEAFFICDPLELLPTELFLFTLELYDRLLDIKFKLFVRPMLLPDCPPHIEKLNILLLYFFFG